MEPFYEESGPRQSQVAWGINMHLIHNGILRDMRLKIVAHYKEAPAAGLPQSRVVKLIFRKVILM